MHTSFQCALYTHIYTYLYTPLYLYTHRSKRALIPNAQTPHGHSFHLVAAAMTNAAAAFSITSAGDKHHTATHHNTPQHIEAQTLHHAALGDESPP